jgi:tetratricopeptide (TPR) repeat protein
MSFDKNKAMRNAERFLSQGKIRAAINEYQRVVENDPKDFSTLNILGDLYAKNHDKQEAVGCFTMVAEHYNTQGFSHKAIAVYNKISRIEPGSIEVSAKLAELYQSKGSVAEARVHYTALAEHYQKRGQKIEALTIWKQIAELDPNNTEIYLKIAETCWQDEQFEDAAQAFTEAGLRFIKQDKFESALTAFLRSLEIKKSDLRALKGLVKAQIGLRCADEAAAKLEEALREQPHNRDILYLLVDCYLDMDNPPQAERAIIKLVEQEPANYPKFLELVKIHLKKGDLDAATRILSMSSEHLLVGGQSDEFLEWTKEILARNPEQINALRLLVRYYGWLGDEAALKQSLERLAEAARLNAAFEDEHYALSQLVMFAPQDVGHTTRLQELNAAYGFETNFPLNQSDFVQTKSVSEIPEFQNFSLPENEESKSQNKYAADFDFADVKGSYNFESIGERQVSLPDDVKEFEFYKGSIEETIIEEDCEAGSAAESQQAAKQFGGELNIADAMRLQKEVDSIEFYIDQGYCDLAEKSLDDLESEFGARPEIVNLRARLDNVFSTPDTENSDQKPIVAENVHQTEYAPETPVQVENANLPQEPIAPQASQNANAATQINGFGILDDLKNELIAEETPTASAEEDYETHYHLATAYKEMGLMENAIREFQDAINLVEMTDGTRRFFQCANLLGHCFMEKQLPKAAAQWLARCLEVEDLNDEEKHAIYYELGNAFEAGGDREKATNYFERLYAENIDYRDVSERLEMLR